MAIDPKQLEKIIQDLGNSLNSLVAKFDSITASANKFANTMDGIITNLLSKTTTRRQETPQEATERKAKEAAREQERADDRAARAAEKAAKETTRAAEKAAKEQQQADDRTARAAEKAANEQQKAADRAAIVAEKIANEQQKAADRAARAAEKAADAKANSEAKQKSAKDPRNIGPAFQEFQSIISTIAAPINFAISGFESLVGVVSSVKDTFVNLAKATAFYVKAFSPVAFKFFENAIYDLHGVIGSLLLPILQSFTAIVRAAADSLVPIVQKLKPAFEQIASAIISFLVPILNTFFNVLDKLTPVITRFTTILGPLASKIGEFVSLLGDELGNIAISIAESFLNLLEALMPLINGLLVLGTSVIPYISNILLAMASAVVGVTSALLMAFLPAIITAAGAVWAALSPIIIPALAIAAAFFAVVKAVQWFTSWFSKAKKDDKKEKQNLLKQTGASVGYGARESKYQSVEELSRSLIASAYSGAASIEKQMLNVEKQQLEVLQKIAGQKLQGPALGQPAPGVR